MGAIGERKTQNQGAATRSVERRGEAEKAKRKAKAQSVRSGRDFRKRKCALRQVESSRGVFIVLFCSCSSSRSTCLRNECVRLARSLEFEKAI